MTLVEAIDKLDQEAKKVGTLKSTNNPDGYLSSEEHNQPLATEEETKMAEERASEATPVTKSYVSPMEGETYPYDEKKSRHIQALIQELVEVVCDVEDGTPNEESPLFGDIRYLANSFVFMARGFEMKKSKRQKALAFEISKLQREHQGDEISETNLQKAIDDWKACKLQLQNLKKHMPEAAELAYENLTGEKPSQPVKAGTRDATTFGNVEANRILAEMGFSKK